LRILDYYWHAAHGHRLLQIPAEWTYFRFGGSPVWNASQRPMPDTLHFTARYEPGAYDIALLHMDQWSAAREYNLRAFKYHFIDDMVRDIPKIVVFHGLPEDAGNAWLLRRMIGCNHVVVNTDMTRELLGLSREQCTAILPGYDVNEWHCDKQVNEIVTVIGGSQTARDHHGVGLLSRMKRALPVTWVGQDITFETFESYRDYLATRSIFFNPTQWSQHPGARNEAMLSGMAVVSTKFLDETLYIRHGVTGFLSNDFIGLQTTLMDLLSNPDKAEAIGLAARESARVMFDKERYVTEWQATIRGLTGA